MYGACNWFSRSCFRTAGQKIPDGTGIHLQGPGEIDLGQKQMHWALASTGVSQPFDIVDIWIDWCWEKIAKDLKNRLDYEKLQVLISDGEPGMENLLTEGMRQQVHLSWH